MADKPRFSKKAFTTLSIVLIGLLISLTGIILYLAPAGRVAHWVEWRFIWLTKEQWQATHTIFSYLFVIAVAFHLYFNWRIFWSYLKARVKGGLRMKRELGAASAITVLVFALVLIEIPPFSTVMNLGAYLTDSWATEQTEPPLPHAEELLVAEYSAAVGLELSAALRHLSDNGITGVDSLRTLGDLAEMNGATPKQIADILNEIQDRSIVNVTQSSGAGYGRMTIVQICEREGIEAAVALQRLVAAGISADESDNIRTLAEKHDLEPVRIIELISGESR